MSEIEKNRQVVQDGLDKRKAKRKKAEEEAYQESIESQMIGIVNKKADNIEAQVKTEIKKAVDHKEKQRNKKKINAIKEKRSHAIIGVFITLVLFTVSGICYTTQITTLWNIIVATSLSAILFIINAYLVVINTIKIARLS